MFAGDFPVPLLSAAAFLSIVQDCVLRKYAQHRTGNGFFYILHPQRMGWAIYFVFEQLSENLLILGDNFQAVFCNAAGAFHPAFTGEFDQLAVQQYIQPVIAAVVCSMAAGVGRKLFSFVEGPLAQDGVDPTLQD